VSFAWAGSKLLWHFDQASSLVDTEYDGDAEHTELTNQVPSHAAEPMAA
jgi:hypothetical protein